jgi:hypothetical protein
MSRGIGKRKKNEWSKVKARGGEKICELLFRDRERERERALKNIKNNVEDE